MIRIFLILLLLIVACGTTDSGEEPAVPGRIVFAGGENSQIFSMNADGSDLRRLTDFEKAEAFQPSWSPDGARIVFAKTATTLGLELYVMDADGGNLRPLKRITEGPLEALIGDNPDWSPDGSRIAYTVCTNCEIGGGDHEVVTVEAAGEIFDQDQLQAVTDHPASDRSPVWSPDGQRIAFTSGRDFFDADTMRFRRDLYMADADGNNLQRLTETGFARNPIWTPNRKMITFRSSDMDLDLGLFQIDLKSGEIGKIEDNLSGDIQLIPQAWSGDGSLLLVIGRHLSQPQNRFIYIIDIVNNQTQRLPFGPTEINGADWFMPPDTQN